MLSDGLMVCLVFEVLVKTRVHVSSSSDEGSFKGSSSELRMK